MKLKDRNPDAILDEAIAAVREEEIDSRVVEEAAERVWRNLTEEAEGSEARASSSEKKLESIEDFKALVPEYVAGRLPEARRILFEDQMRDSVALRRAVQEARGVERSRGRRREASSVLHSPWFKWGALAAMILLTAGLAQLGFLDGILPRTTVGMTSVRSVDGSVFQLSGGSMQVLAAGDEVGWQQGIRTAKDTHLIIDLADGSTVEIRERTEYELSEARDGITINLHRGGIIVNAARQEDSNLYVRTDDCLVSVTGTIFSVNTGAKGTRVSVIEGEVRVEHGGRRETLGAGEQYTTHERLARVPLPREIAWSKEYDKHLALLREAKVLDEELTRTFFPGLRFSSRFLDVVPASTVIYAGLPNLGTSLAEAHDIFMKRVERNPALEEWWREAVKSEKAQISMMEVVERMRQLSNMLGDELVLAVTPNEKGQPDNPLFLAETTDPAGFRAALQDELVRLKSETGLQAVVITDDPSALAPAKDTLFVFLRQDVVAASPNAQPLLDLEAALAAGRSGFAGGDFHRHLDELYRDGVDWVFGVNMAELMAGEGADDPIARKAGILDVEHFFAEVREHGGSIENRAMLTFREERKGIASWLSPPAPLGGLDFVSADAAAAFGFAVKEPAQLLDEIVRLFGNDAEQALAEIEAETGINVQGDLAAPLGGEFVFALDGALLPVPNWKAVIEVYNPDRLQDTIESIVQRANQELREEGKPPVTLTSTSSGGRVYYNVSVPAWPLLSFSYAYVDGFLLAAPSRGLIRDALQFREIGATLPNSPEFVNLLPRDGHTGYSAVAYQNLRATLEPLAALGRSVEMPEEQRQLIDEALDGMSASLVCAYAEEDRILFATTGSMVLDPSSLMGLKAFSLPGMEEVLERLPGITGN